MLAASNSVVINNESNQTPADWSQPFEDEEKSLNDY